MVAGMSHLGHTHKVNKSTPRLLLTYEGPWEDGQICVESSSVSIFAFSKNREKEKKAEAFPTDAVIWGA